MSAIYSSVSEQMFWQVKAYSWLTLIGSSLSLQIAALESELMQLMKQNGIQVNNNNSNSAERLSAQQHSPNIAAAQARGQFMVI